MKKWTWDKKPWWVRLLERSNRFMGRVEIRTEKWREKAEKWQKDREDIEGSRYDVSDAQLKDKPFCAGILKLAKRQMQETAQWYKDVQLALPKFEPVTSLAHKVTSAIMMVTINIEMQILRHLDKEYYVPDRADLYASGVAASVAQLMCIHLRRIVEKKEEVSCSEVIAKQFAAIYTVPFPLFSDEKKKEILTIGQRYVEETVNSDHKDVVQLRDNIEGITIAYIMNQIEPKVEDQKIVNAFCSIAENLRKSIE